MRSVLRRLLRRPIGVVDRRFEHADRGLLDSVDTVVRHTDVRFGELAAVAERHHREAMEASERRQSETIGLLRPISETVGRVDQHFEMITSATVEASAYIGRALREMRDTFRYDAEQLHGLLQSLNERRLDEVHNVLRDSVELRDRLQADLKRWVEPDATDLRDLDGVRAAFLNFAESHRGFAAQAGLWLNPPVSTEYAAGAVRVGDVNERIVEVPYALAAVSRLPVGASVLDVGAVESTLSLSMASLGYHVTAVDLRPYPFKHPRLTAVTVPLEEWEGPDQPFDAILVISTIEHLGLGAYGEPQGPEDLDVRMMRKIRSFAREGTLLVLTTPFGEFKIEESQRVYDKARLDDLLEGWTIEDWTVMEQLDRTTWVLSDDGASHRDGRKVVMVVASAS